MSELCSYAKRFEGLAVTTLPWSTCLCSDCCKKCTVFSPGSFLLFCTE